MQVQAARIGKPHGIRGEVTVQLYTDDPQTRLAVGSVLGVEPPTPLAPQGRLSIAGVKWNKNVLVLRFAEVHDRNEAESLRNHYLVLDTEEAEETEGYYEHELVGLPVHAVENPEDPEPGEPVGTVTGLRTLPTQDLLVVELTTGGEALIPFVEEIVPEVDLEARRVVISPPPGLLDLNGEASETPGEDA